MKPKSEGKIPQSETVIIKRSQIKFAPYNPKRHTDDSIKQQAKNFKSVGFLGGIVWNSVTGNLISGHKRVMAMDKIYGNTTETPVDYDVKVEKVALDHKKEMEQNVFMDARSTNTDQDYELLAVILPEIDPKEAGLDDLEIDLIVAESPELEAKHTEEIKKDYKAIEKPYEDRKAALQEAKKEIRNNIATEQGASYVTLSFDNYENKAQFMMAMGYDSEATIIKGELFYDKLQNQNEEQ